MIFFDTKFSVFSYIPIGIYEKISVAKLSKICLLIDIAKNKSNNDELMVVYRHIFPFEKATYFCRKKRRIRFFNRILTKEEFEIELSKQKEEFQREIMNFRKK